jgi:hypothetical protein
VAWRSPALPLESAHDLLREHDVAGLPGEHERPLSGRTAVGRSPRDVERDREVELGDRVVGAEAARR